MDGLRPAAAPPMPGIRWLTFWNYAALPAGAVIALLMAFAFPIVRYEIVPMTLLCAAVAFGLHQRRLWAWQWNWAVLAVIGVALIVPVPIRATYTNFVDFFTHGVTDLLSIEWVHDSLGDLAVPILIRLILVTLFWVWPNWRYWRKREALFS